MNIKEKLFMPYFISICIFTILFKFINRDIIKTIFSFYNLIIAIVILYFTIKENKNG